MHFFVSPQNATALLNAIERRSKRARDLEMQESLNANWVEMVLHQSIQHGLSIKHKYVFKTLLMIDINIPVAPTLLLQLSSSSSLALAL